MVWNLSEDLREKLEDFGDASVVNGARPVDMFDAIIAQAAELREACARDADPVDDADTDAIGEPPNDWPAAEPDKPQTKGA